MQRAAFVPPPQQLQFKNNLLMPVPTLIGREHELETACAFLRHPDVRLLTLTGPGGVGKTCLALQVATEVGTCFADGIFFISLAPVSDPGLVVPTVAQALGLREAGSRSIFEHLKEFLRDKSLLLLLDNFEQIVSAAHLLPELIIACPGVKLLVTSRSVLHVRVELAFPLAPLVLPDLKSGRSPHIDIESLSRNAAVALFLQHAQAIKPTFYLTRANACTIAEICVHLDGLPLAIELAAARIRLLSPDKLLVRLKHPLDVLTGGARDLPERQQTLRNTIKWSYDLLTTGEQQLFRRLAIFNGGCTLEAAEAVVPAVGHLGTNVLDGLTSLMDNHLLQQSEGVEGEPRMVMLETIREFALECLAMHGEVEAARRAHADYYLALADEASRQTRCIVWLDHLEHEHDNLRAALTWLTEQEKAEMALHLSNALLWFWELRGYLSEGRQWLERALAASGRASAATRAKALNRAGALAYFQGDYGRTETYCRESMALFRELGDTSGFASTLTTFAMMERSRGRYAEAHALLEAGLVVYRELKDAEGIMLSQILLASVLTYQGHYTRAQALIEEGLAKARELGNNDATGDALNIAATIAFLQGHYATTRSRLEEGLALHRAMGDQRGRAYDLSFLGYLTLFSEQDYAAAQALVEEGLALFEEVGDRRGIAKAQYRLGRIAFDQGDHPAAYTFYEQGLAILWEVEDTWSLTTCLESVARVAVAQGHSAWATRLCGAAQALREAIGAAIPPIERANHERTMAAARTQLGNEVFPAIWAEGHTMTPLQAFTARGPASAAQMVSSMPKPMSPAYPAGLTAREVAVLRLVAEGLTDAQVAQRLVLSPRTISTHLRSIYNKLRINSRSAATRFAIEHHLV